MSWIRRNKFGTAKKTERDGYSFSSRLEADTYSLLKRDEVAGVISTLRCQVQVYLTRAKILYKPDFSWTDSATGEEVFGEAKGIETAVWRIKRRLWKFYGPGKLLVFKQTRLGPELFETIDPRIDAND